MNFVLDRMVMEPFDNRYREVGFISANSLYTDVKEYIDETGDGELGMLFDNLKKGNKNKLLCTKIHEICTAYFGHEECEYKRYPSTNWPQRPWGLTNVSLSSSINKDDFTRQYTPFLLAEKKSTTITQEKLPDWFKSETCIKSVFVLNQKTIHTNS